MTFFFLFITSHFVLVMLNAGKDYVGCMRWAFLHLALLGIIIFIHPPWCSSCHSGYCHWILQLQEACNITWCYSCYIPCESATAIHSNWVFEPGNSPWDGPRQYSFQVCCTYSLTCTYSSTAIIWILWLMRMGACWTWLQRLYQWKLMALVVFCIFQNY